MTSLSSLLVDSLLEFGIDQIAYLYVLLSLTITVIIAKIVLVLLVLKPTNSTSITLGFSKLSCKLWEIHDQQYQRGIWEKKIVRRVISRF